MSGIDALRQFYQAGSNDGESLFDIWERGEARGDSVTPATYSREYRELIYRELADVLGEPGDGALLSIGCGNAVIEAELSRNGYRVLAVDVLDRAVRLARQKGLETVQADVRYWSPPRRNWAVVYADGVLGYLYEPGEAKIPVLGRIREWLTASDGVLVASNDMVRDASDAQPAAGVPNFYWLSPDFLRRELEAAGFSCVSISHFSYQRPTSGPRQRLILRARARLC